VLCGTLALRLGTEWSLPAFLLLAVLGVQLARIDLAHHLLPNPLVLTLLLAGLALLFVGSSAAAEWGELLRALAGAALLFIVFLILALISPNGIGMGDVKLAAPVGLYLGYLGWSQLFYGGALGFVLGGILSAVLIRLKHANLRSEVAFGPSMLAAALGTVLLAS
jgi:leader peptidase (prepilin peptidase)/N-methyltransferase